MLLRNRGITSYTITIRGSANTVNKRKIRVPKPVYLYALREAEIVSKNTGRPINEVLPEVLRSPPVQKYLKSYMEYVEIEI